MGFHPSDWSTLAIRMVLALFVGGVIGWNRQESGKPAGLRTHMLVSLGAAVFVMIPIQIHPQGLDATSRAIQGVATGIGFLGAGEILHVQRRSQGQIRPKVKGLTSAAALWVSAALGIAAGAGLWQLCLMGTLMTQFVLSGIKRLEYRIFSQHTDEAEEE